MLSIISCLVSSEGEEWQSIRSLLGKHMLRPKAVEAYDQTLNNVVGDLITKLRLRRSSQDLVTDIASEFYRFGLEGEEELQPEFYARRLLLQEKTSPSFPYMPQSAVMAALRRKRQLIKRLPCSSAVWLQAFPPCCSSPESAAWTRSSPRRRSVSFSASTPCL